MDFTLYWFMFPVSMLVATTAMLSGIGGAALFTPIFFIIFPLLGPEYVLASASAAIGVALLTEVFGFSSGFIAYHRKRLIDFKSAVPFLMVSVPVAIGGAIVLQYMNRNFLTGAYGALMLALAWVMAKHSHGVHEEDIEANGDGSNGRPRRQVIAADGTVHIFYKPIQTAKGLVTAVGAFLTGLLSVGIGEVVMPQLAKANRVPIPVAAATSVFTVIVTIAAASFTQIVAIIEQGGWSAVPWNVVAYTIPAVIIGGQIGPRLQGKVPQRPMETAIGILFAVIAIAMFYITWQGVMGSASAPAAH